MHLKTYQMKSDKYILCIEQNKLLKKDTKLSTIFMNSEKSKTSVAHRLSLNHLDKIDLRRKNKYIVLLTLSIYYTWKNIRKSYKNNKFKISAPTWNKQFELPDGSYSITDVQGYF